MDQRTNNEIRPRSPPGWQSISKLVACTDSLELDGLENNLWEIQNLLQGSNSGRMGCTSTESNRNGRTVGGASTHHLILHSGVLDGPERVHHRLEEVANSWSHCRNLKKMSRQVRPNLHQG